MIHVQFFIECFPFLGRRLFVVWETPNKPAGRSPFHGRVARTAILARGRARSTSPFHGPAGSAGRILGSLNRSVNKRRSEDGNLHLVENRRNRRRQTRIANGGPNRLPHRKMECLHQQMRSGEECGIDLAAPSIGLARSDLVDPTMEDIEKMSWPTPTLAEPATRWVESRKDLAAETRTMLGRRD